MRTGQDEVTALEITVRGSAATRHPAERATVRLAAATEGADMAKVFADAVAVQDQLSSQLRDVVDARPVVEEAAEEIVISVEVDARFRAE